MKVNFYVTVREQTTQGVDLSSRGRDWSNQRMLGSTSNLTHWRDISPTLNRHISFNDPASTRHLAHVGPTLGHRLRRCPTLAQQRLSALRLLGSRQIQCEYLSRPSVNISIRTGKQIIPDSGREGK